MSETRTDLPTFGELEEDDEFQEFEEQGDLFVIYNLVLLTYNKRLGGRSWRASRRGALGPGLGR
jgi:hypothetical protein